MFEPRPRPGLPIAATLARRWIQNRPERAVTEQPLPVAHDHQPYSAVEVENHQAGKRARGKRPCPLWVDAFQRDTQHLAADEVVAYFLILMAMWVRETCDFPDDDRRLAAVSRVSLRLWKSRIGPAVKEFLEAENGVLISRRLRKEADYVERHCKAQSDRKSGNKSNNPLKNNNPSSTTDVATVATADVSTDRPTQHPNNPTTQQEPFLTEWTARPSMRPLLFGRTARIG